MESGRGGTSVRTKFGATIMLMGLLTGLLALMGPQAGAVPVPVDADGSITGFEIDGNQADDPAGGALDWEDLALLTPAADADSLTVVTDDTIDSGLRGSSKENDPSGWTCNEGGAKPPKNNILHAAVNTRVSEDGPFVDIAYMREGQTGNAHVNFEFNQNSITDQCPFVGRTTGDLLLLFNFPGGAGQADVAAFLWDAAVSDDGQWVTTDVPANSAAAISNPGATPDFIFPDVDATLNRQFGEASLNLSAIVGTDEDSCVSFGTLNVRSRSSAGNLEEDSNSINSALQDRLAPTPVEISTCGSIKIKKVDGAGELLDGATFGLFDSAEAAAGGDPAVALETCITGELAGDADEGLCTFGGLVPGDYWVAELAAPDGYEMDANPVLGPITVGIRDDVDLTGDNEACDGDINSADCDWFVNDAIEGYVDVQVVKTTTTPRVIAGGAVEFDVTITNNGPAVAERVAFGDDLPDGVVWSFKPNTTHVGCSLDEATNNLSCSVVQLGDDESVTITLVGTTDVADCPSITNPVSSVSATNESESAPTANNSTAVVTINVGCPRIPPPPPTPLDITIVKDGPALAHRGDEITYTFTVTNSGQTSLVNVVLTDPICDAGTLKLVDDGNGDTPLAVGEVWTYECTRVITATDPDPLPNTATVVGTDVDGRTTGDEDDHLVDLIEPAIDVVKTVDDVNPAVGQTVTFTYVVTNTGDTTLFDVAVVDDQLGAIGTIPVLAAGDSATLTKTMLVAANSPLRNIATATGDDVLGKTVTDDDDATITVVLGKEVLAKPPAAPSVEPVQLPRTGSDAHVLLLVSGVLLMLGGLLVASGEGWEPLTATIRRRRG